MNSLATQDYGRIDFMKFRLVAVALSSVLILISVVSLAFNGLNFGVDFTGGTLVELKFQKEANLADLRNALNNRGFGRDVQVNHFGSSEEALVRVAPTQNLSNAKMSNIIIDTAREVAGDGVEMRRVEFVGPQVGEELTNEGGLAILYALACILMYISFRFEWRFAIGSVVALLHDVLITLGVFSVFQIEFNLTVLAAILAVIGYSLNDTIVVFDRIRESFLNVRSGLPEQIVNLSINDMLSRTLMTSITTLLVLIALFLFGGEIINAFSIALILGVVVGTYSSIYVSGTVSLMLGIRKEHFQPPKKEGAEQAVEKETQQKQMLQQMRHLAEMEQESEAKATNNPHASPKRKATKSKKTKRKK